MTIEVHDYDPGWPDLARVACDEVRAAIGGALDEIEHIGSTSVVGLAAKPVIDLMARTEDLAKVTAVAQTLDHLGYRLLETGMRGRLFYRREGEPVSYHLHIVTNSSWATQNERILRDHLRSEPADAARYGQLKRDLAATRPDGDTYTRAKTDLIQEMVDRARSRRGLPLVPVWEE